jgi:SAM-dependent methyltransferase
MSITGQELYHGLAALSWRWLNLSEAKHRKDLFFFERIVAQNGGVALDVGCGTGRILRHLLRAGLRVEGCDISADMLTHCRELLAIERLATTLYETPMQALDLPRQYHTIIVPCGSFALLCDREAEREALRRFYHHLIDGGQLVLTAFWPEWGCYQLDHPREAIPSPWRFHFEVSHHDAALKVYRRLTRLDLWQQIFEEDRRYELYVNGQLTRTETHTGLERWFFKNELLLLLELTGFSEIRAQRDYSDDAAQPIDPYVTVFIATK